jgi:hypothetical protein
MKRETPIAPSLPTTAISADCPFSSTYSSDTIAFVGK